MSFRILPWWGLAVIAGLASCSTGDDGSPEPINTQFDAPVLAGGAGPRYEEPILITDGDYWPSDLDAADLSDRYDAAERGDAPPFRGELAGITVIPLSEATPDDRPNRCDVVEFQEEVRFEFKYLPKGTSAASPQYAAYCDDKRLNFAAQEFVTKHGSLRLTFSATDRVLIYDAPQNRLGIVEINGSDALAMQPSIPEGLGTSLIALSTANGHILASATGLPFSELVSVVKELTCAAC